MKNILFSFLFLLSSLFVLNSCSNSYDGLENQQLDTTPPGKVEIKEVIPKSGALEIKFSLPKGETDIVQVIASYIKNGKKVDFNASRYVSSILVEGFIGTTEQNVSIVCIDNSGNVSEPVIVKATPLLSPLEEAFKSIRAIPAFGGVKLFWKNTTGDFLAIHVLTEDTVQIKGQTIFVEDPTKLIYTRDTVEKKTSTYIRQYPDIEQKFGFSISDKWGNVTDTAVFMIKPMREDLVDYKHIKDLDVFNPHYTSGASLDYEQYGINPSTGLQNDGCFYNRNPHGPQGLFDNVFNNGNFMIRYTKNLSDSDPKNREVVLSNFCTYDLNVEVKLGRMHVYWWCNQNTRYRNHSVRKWRMWGTTDENNDRFSKFPEGWVMIGEYQAPDAVNPSNLSPDEIDAWDKGFEFSVSDDNLNPEADPSIPIRYLRIEILESYDIKQTISTWAEMKLYGEVSKKFYK